jgi:uroporphyrinogen decarboxylase
MNSLDRVMAAINFEKTDRVPVDLHNFLVTCEYSGLPYDEVLQSGEKMADAQIRLWERLGHDMLLVENGTTAVAGALGCVISYAKKGPPRIIKPILEDDLNDFKKLKMIDPYQDGSLPELLKATRLLREYFGDKVCIMGRADQGPFSLAVALRGIENFMMDLMDQEKYETIHQLIEFCTEVYLKFAEAQIKSGAHCTSMGDGFAGPSIVSPDIYEKFAFPYQKKVGDFMKAKGYISSNHYCGNSTKIVPRLVETGIRILEIDDKTDLKVATEYAKGKTCILGNVSTTVLHLGTPEDVRKLACEAIEIAGKNSGFILGPGCALAGEVPMENIEALIGAART